MPWYQFLFSYLLVAIILLGFLLICARLAMSFCDFNKRLISHMDAIEVIYKKLSDE